MTGADSLNYAAVESNPYTPLPVARAGEAPIPRPPTPAAPTVNAGVIGAAMQPVAGVSGTQTAGNVAAVNPAQFGLATATAATSSGYDAAQTGVKHWDVGSDQTVAGQVAKITAADGPLAQAAATRAAQTANARGLINSSMAVQSGQEAVLNSALPIAQADAATYSLQGRTNTQFDNDNAQFNTNATNASRQFNTGAGNAAKLVDAQAANNLQSQQIDNQAKAVFANTAQVNDARKYDAQAGLQAAMANQDVAVKQSAIQYDASVKAALQNADMASKTQLQSMDASTRQYLADVEAKYKTRMQTSASMTSTYQSMIDNITRVMQDKDLDAGGKQAAIDNLRTLYNGALAAQETVSGLNLGRVLSPEDFVTTAPAAAGAPAPAPAPTPAFGSFVNSRYWGGGA